VPLLLRIVPSASVLHIVPSDPLVVPRTSVLYVVPSEDLVVPKTSVRHVVPVLLSRVVPNMSVRKVPFWPLEHVYFVLPSESILYEHDASALPLEKINITIKKTTITAITHAFQFIVFWLKCLSAILFASLTSLSTFFALLIIFSLFVYDLLIK